MPFKRFTARSAPVFDPSQMVNETGESMYSKKEYLSPYSKGWWEECTRYKVQVSYRGIVDDRDLIKVMTEKRAGYIDVSNAVELVESNAMKP